LKSHSSGQNLFPIQPRPAVTAKKHDRGRDQFVDREGSGQQRAGQMRRQPGKADPDAEQHGLNDPDHDFPKRQHASTIAPMQADRCDGSHSVVLTVRWHSRIRFTSEVEMLAWALLVANMPTIVCTICSAFLAYKERPQWVWFAALAVLAGIGGLLTLGVVHAQQLA
jgi:hypothetical protein